MYYLYTCSNQSEVRTLRGGSSAPVAATVMGADYPIDEDFAVYAWDHYSTLSHNPPEVLHPIDPDTNENDVRAGRWIHIDFENQAAPQVNADWNAVGGLSLILNKPTLATVATSGVYSDLAGKPTIPAAQVNSDWNSNSGVSQILNKPSLATVATSGSYNDLTNKPTIQAIQRTRAQTNTSGVYTWTFPLAYGSGIIPIISVDIEDGSSATWNAQITSVSNTSATIQLTKTTSVTILGISVLGIAATPQAYVHLTAVAP